MKITTHSLANEEVIAFDIESKTLKLMNPVKTLNTGMLYRHYRSSDMFIVREQVLMGFKKSFLDAIDIFTLQGFHVTSIYRIRDCEWSSHVSRTHVENALRTYLSSKHNIDKFLHRQLVQLYDEFMGEMGHIDEENFDDIEALIVVHNR